MYWTAYGWMMNWSPARGQWSAITLNYAELKSLTDYTDDTDFYRCRRSDFIISFGFSIVWPSKLSHPITKTQKKKEGSFGRADITFHAVLPYIVIINYGEKIPQIKYVLRHPKIRRLASIYLTLKVNNISPKACAALARTLGGRTKSRGATIANY